MQQSNFHKFHKLKESIASTSDFENNILCLFQKGRVIFHFIFWYYKLQKMYRAAIAATMEDRHHRQWGSIFRSILIRDCGRPWLVERYRRGALAFLYTNRHLNLYLASIPVGRPTPPSGHCAYIIAPNSKIWWGILLFP